MSDLKKGILIGSSSSLILIIIVFVLVSWIASIVNYSYDGMRCRDCHIEFNRLVSIGEIDICAEPLPLIFNEPFEYTLEQYRIGFSYMCEPCLNRLAYASSEGYNFDHPAWRGFIE